MTAPDTNMGVAAGSLTRGGALRRVAGSLAARLSLFATVTLLVALGFYGYALRDSFEDHVSERFYRELEAHLAQLTVALELAEGGGVAVVDDLSDPRFERPFSGLYWIVRLSDEDGGVLSSRSLWDLPPPVVSSTAEGGRIERHRALPLGRTRVLAVSRTVILEQEGRDQRVQLAVALDQRELTAALEAFDARSIRLILLLAGLLAIAVSIQIGFGLAPLRRLRAQLQEVAQGGSGGLSGRFPGEVQRLVDALNALLEARGVMIAEARAQAGDLAHGLKTPLAVMAAEARKLRSEGREQAGAELLAQIERMRRHVERRLAQAGARGRAQALDQPTSAHAAIDKLIRAMRAAPGGDALTWENAIDPELRLAIHPIDFDEVVGNLLDNARKWAGGRVRLSAIRRGSEVSVLIEDDGPGAPAADRERLTKRGERLDETLAGAGLGLAIAADLVEAYGGVLALSQSQLGGLEARATLPIGAGTVSSLALSGARQR